MRHYALLLGLLLTAGSTYILHLAVGSAGFERLTGARASAMEPVASTPQEIWYGGVIAPVTIEARRGAPPAVVLSWIRMIEGSKREAVCTRANQPKAPAAERERHRTVGVGF
jgi:hypothetical protein